MNIVLIGPPGSGKGSLSNLLKNQYGFTHISTGDLLRKEVATGSELGKEISRLIDAGNMVSDEISLNVMKNEITKSNGNCIFDGYPRNLFQAKLLESTLLDGKTDDLIILYFDISLEKLIDRITNRVTCNTCGEIYNLKTKPPIIENDNEYFCKVCPKEISQITKRKDDNVESLKTRFSVFQQNTLPLLQYYQSSGFKFIQLDADKTIQEIESLVIDQLQIRKD